MTEEYTGDNCCAECTCTNPHKSKGEPTGIISSEGFPTTETSTNCCVECICLNTHQSKPPTE